MNSSPPSDAYMCQWIWSPNMSILLHSSQHFIIQVKSLFTVTSVLFYFLHAIWCPEHAIPLKQLLIPDFAIVANGSLFWFSIVTSPQLICDVTRMLDTGIMTSYLSIVLARTNWRKVDLH